MMDAFLRGFSLVWQSEFWGLILGIFAFVAVIIFGIGIAVSFVGWAKDRWL
jgi:hypothetical protein